MSLPREVTFDSSIGALRFQPYRKLEMLRDEKGSSSWRNIHLAAPSNEGGVTLVMLDGVDSVACKVEVEFVAKKIDSNMNWCNLDSSDSVMAMGIRGVTPRTSN